MRSSFQKDSVSSLTSRGSLAFTMTYGKRSCLMTMNYVKLKRLLLLSCPQEREQSEGTDTKGNWGSRGGRCRWAWRSW